MKFIFIFATFFSIPSLFGQHLLDFSMSSCSERSYPEFIRNRIVYKEMNDEILTVRLALVLNCCPDIDLRINYENDSLFVQIEDTASMLCMCECCFEIVIRASGIPNTDFTMIYEKEEINIDDEIFKTVYTPYELEEHPYKYAFPTYDELHVYEQQTEEMNQITEDDQRVGLWRFSKDERNLLAFYKIDNNGKSKMDWRALYDVEGKLISIGGNVGLGNSSTADKRDYYRLFNINENDD